MLDTINAIFRDIHAQRFALIQALKAGNTLAAARARLKLDNLRDDLRDARREGKALAEQKRVVRERVKRETRKAHDSRVDASQFMRVV